MPVATTWNPQRPLPLCLSSTSSSHRSSCCPRWSDSQWKPSSGMNQRPSKLSQVWFEVSQSRHWCDSQSRLSQVCTKLSWSLWIFMVWRVCVPLIFKIVQKKLWKRCVKIPIVRGWWCQHAVFYFLWNSCILGFFTSFYYYIFLPFKTIFDLNTFWSYFSSSLRTFRSKNPFPTPAKPGKIK